MKNITKLSCPNCKNSIKWVDLVSNVNSIYFKTEGLWKCKNCHEKITLSQISKIKFIIFSFCIFFSFLFLDEIAELIDKYTGVNENIISLFLIIIIILFIYKYRSIEIIKFNKVSDSRIEFIRTINFKKLIQTIPLNASHCLIFNSLVGFFILFAGLINGIFYLKENPSIPFIDKIIFLQIFIGFLLFLGYLLFKVNINYINSVLVFQGLILIALAIVYSVFMLYVEQQIINNSLEIGGVAHVPGILAFGFAYSIRQIIDFSVLRKAMKPNLIKMITIISISIGGLFDLTILYFMIVILQKNVL